MKKPIRESEHPGTEECRGMSEPFYFAFNVITDKRQAITGRPKVTRMLCHAVIFTSFEIPAESNATCTICHEDTDPRMKAFIRFVYTNWIRERRAAMKEKFGNYYDEASDELKPLVKKFMDYFFNEQ